MYKVFRQLYRHTFKKITGFDQTKPVEFFKRLTGIISSSPIKKTYVPIEQDHIRNYVFSKHELSALKLIIEKLELPVSVKTLLPYLRERMSKKDWDNLLMLLAFVRCHHFIKPPPDGGKATITRMTDLMSNPAPSSRRRNILFITGQFPNPVHGGGNRVVDFIKIIQRDHNVYLYSSFRKNEDIAAYQALSPYCQKIETVDFQYFEGSLDRIKNFVGNIPIDIVHYEWRRSLTNYDASLGKYHIFTYMEAVSLRLLMDLAFESALSSRWVDKLIELLNALKIEVTDAAQMDARFVVTHKDGEFLARFNPAVSFFILNHGINPEEFCLPDKQPEENTLVFVGNYWHYPNEDAVQFFFTRIFELIKAQIPQLKIYLVGANPTKKVKAHQNDQQVVVTGMVNDIRPYIQQAAICIAPLITGAGIRTKVIQYAALKRVCVATSIAAADLTFEDGTDIFIADDPVIFAEKIIYLLQHPEIAQQMSQLAYQKARLHYDNQLLIQYLYQFYDYLDSQTYPNN